MAIIVSESKQFLPLNKHRAEARYARYNMTWTIEPVANFSKHADAWQRINQGAHKSPLLSPDFLNALLAQFSSGREKLAIYTVDGEPAAMAIVHSPRTGVWETFQPSQAPIGMWVQRLGLSQRTLLASLVRALPGLNLIIGLTQQDPLITPRPSSVGALRTMDYIQTARITVAGDFENYWAARGKNLRSNLKKQRSKLAKDGVQTRMTVSRAPEEMAAAVADYGRLESAGWKAQGGTAIHPENDQGRFYTDMLSAFCLRGAGAVYRYYFDEQLVAMDLCIEGAGSIIILKTTYDETVPNSLSPTLLMREEETRQIFEEARFERIEFYGKLMEWHTKWTEEVRTMYHTTGYRWPSLLGLRQIKKYPSIILGQLRSQRRVSAG